ncbi:S46 family peptidase [Maribellus maritimus]|uniref:S46 family peptidase n=1 Tax=Maribellus maritimus TaxID=2870838 RepID=UPI001EEC518C|nr:S46 family peptidase [Maribellus maritimus]MCG6187536.1 S46 family peptidase [Maribellus maritimus]
MRKLFGFVFLFLFISLIGSAKEGMWIPTLLGKYNIEEMQQMGFKLTAQDIYDVNHASMKDAVVIFGSGCTGELISEEGLLITNHHCGYRQIQSHSSVENDILTNGFWAMNKGEELPNPGLTVRFLEYMKDVTDEVLENTEGLSEEKKVEVIQRNCGRIETDASGENKYRAQVKPLFYGNQYFLYVYKTYTDVRLVGAPPSAIGKFGGDTDNWMWPRHTGDFSVFRIYADANNEPAEYSQDNVPFKPKKFLPISIKGIQPGDFTMVFGNPGSTQQYVPHQEVDIIMNQRDPDRIKLRDIKLQIIGAAMEKDPKVRIQYSAKYQGISNAWKKWQGEIKGLQRLDAVHKKMEFEEEFKNWAEKNSTWQTMYQPVFNDFEVLYDQYQRFIKASDYYSEIVLRGPDIFKLATMANAIVNNIESDQPERVESLKLDMEKSLDSFFKDFNQTVDEKLFSELLPLLKDELDPEFLPYDFQKLMNKNDKEKLLKKVYRKSILTEKETLAELLATGNEKQLLKLRKDPLITMARTLNFYYNVKIKPIVDTLKENIDRNMKIYMAGIMEMQSNKPLYPDANLTLRVTYGKVEGYEPFDGVKYKYCTTLSGIMKKDNPEIYDYDVPERLKELFREKDFGKYEVNGDVPVCFTASNHTSGGNSGSPVINAKGELIGLNFDRCWEGTMSDIMYDPEMCRNITLDIRYALFIIEKFAGAGYLLEEMEIVE